jgi:hypothetical protein
MQDAAANPQVAWDVGRLLSQTAVACGLIGMCVRGMILWRRGTPVGLGALTSALMTGAGAPVGLFLICCAFKPELTHHLKDLNIALAAAGVCTLYIAYKGLISD